MSLLNFDPAGYTPQPIKTEPKPVPLLPEEVDYNKIYEGLQERFNKAYAISQKLFITEKTQRQTLYNYKRQNNAILDFLAQLEEVDDDLDQPLEIDHNRIANLISLNSDLHQKLAPLLQMASEPPQNVQLGGSYNVELTVNEMIPELVCDELDTVEVNPQDTEMWTRRNYSHLVLSKFKPVEVRSKGVREYIDSASLNTKRRKKLPHE